MSKSLDQLREEIDSVDDQMHDLLMKRADLHDEVAALKSGAAPEKSRMRPGREAQILRRLYARHSGSLPFRAISQIWRQLLSASLAQQGRISVCIWGGEDVLPVWDMAREQYGLATNFTRSETARDALARVDSGASDLAVLAWRDEEAWWSTLPALKEDQPAGLQIIARLPFYSAPLRADAPALVGGRALVVAAFERERQRLRVGLQAKLQSPGRIADEVFYAKVYGDHPYAHPPEGDLES
ncbi:MAG: chorismate mutase, partial [Alphaproteobacteria bacterium]|nr:chorismate mutase [Alphaproteobacteria bacterium]